jgi:hypothetical protein
MSNRPPTDPGWLPSPTVSGNEGPPQKAEAVREAYKRHSSELVTIDEQQTKLLLVMLGIFSAGATFLTSCTKSGDSTCNLTPEVQWGLTTIAVALLWLWAWYTLERHAYRRAVRDLLVRCELALGFYAKDAYLEGATLYLPEERQFPFKGQFMLWTHLGTVALAGAGFLVVLRSPLIFGMFQSCAR